MRATDLLSYDHRRQITADNGTKRAIAGGGFARLAAPSTSVEASLSKTLCFTGAT